MLFYAGQILEQSLLMFPLVLGLYVSFSVLKIADLSVDGSFVMGACVFATLITKGVPLFFAMLLATVSGMAAGGICALVQERNRIDPLIAGILMAFILHSLSLLVMQRPNIGLLNSTTIFRLVAQALNMSASSARVLTLLVLVSAFSVAVTVFLASSRGLWLKAFGNSQELVSMLGQNPERLRFFGLALGNGLAAVSGCLMAQASGYADINMGFGQALIGIAMILLGRELLRFLNKLQAPHDSVKIFCTFVGVWLYFLLTNELIRHGLSPIYLKMAVGILLIGFLWLASNREAHRRSLS